MANDPRGAAQFAALNAADRAAAEKIIASMIIPEERRTALLNALKSLSK
jgi:hypothetical protein